MEDKRLKGRRGEDIAKKYLENKGYTIIKMNYQKNIGEIDIICKYEDTVIFVEVKYRENLNFGHPLEAIDYRKQNKIRKVANWYISENQLDSDFRFDCIGIIMYPELIIEHIENAF